MTAKTQRPVGTKISPGYDVSFGESKGSVVAVALSLDGDFCFASRANKLTSTL